MQVCSGWFEQVQSCPKTLWRHHLTTHRRLGRTPSPQHFPLRPQALCGRLYVYPEYFHLKSNPIRYSTKSSFYLILKVMSLWPETCDNSRYSKPAIHLCNAMQCWSIPEFTLIIGIGKFVLVITLKNYIVVFEQLWGNNQDFWLLGLVISHAFIEKIRKINHFI